MDNGDLKSQLEGLFSNMQERESPDRAAPLDPGERAPAREAPGKQERYRGLMEKMPIGIFRSTPEPHARFLMANAAFLRMFGFDSLEALGQTAPSDLYQNPDEEKSFLSRLLMQGSLTGVEMALKKTDGTPIWCSVTATTVYEDDEQAVCFDCAVEDITGRKQAEAGDDHWKRRYDLASAFLGQVVYEYDTRSGDMLWGGSVDQVLGYVPAEMSGGINQWAQMVHPDDRWSLLAVLDAAEEKSSPYEAAYRLRHKQGHYVAIHERGFFVPHSTGQAARRLGIMMQDIAGRKPADPPTNLSGL